MNENLDNTKFCRPCGKIFKKESYLEHNKAHKHLPITGEKTDCEMFEKKPITTHNEGHLNSKGIKTIKGKKKLNSK